MKKSCLWSVMTLACIAMYAQDREVVMPVAIFTKENLIIDVERNLDLRFLNVKQDGNKVGDISRTRLDLGITRMFTNRFGAGIDISYDHSKFENGTEVISSSFDGGLHVLYGSSISSTVGFLAKLGGGIGKEKEEVTSGSSSNENKWDYLVFRGSVGFPIRLQQSPVYFTPRLMYKRYCYEYEDDDEESQNIFGLHVGLLAALGSGQFNFSSQHTPSLYTAGNHYISYYTKGMFTFGNSEITSPSNEFKSDFSDYRVRFDYAYYFMNNFYGGLEFMWSGSSVEPGWQPDYKATENKFTLEPKIGLNFPVTSALNNMFVEFGYTFGKEKFKEEFNGNEDEENYDLSGYSGTIGYNIPMARQLSLVPRLSYNSMTTEFDDPSFGFEEKRSGLNVSVGLRYHIIR